MVGMYKYKLYFVGNTALILASSGGHFKIVQALILYSANVNSRNNNGGNALMSASLNGHFNIVKVLLEIGAKLNETDVVFGNLYIFIDI